MIIGSVFNLLCFLFLPKKLNIKIQENGRYMIVKEIKQINIFKYLNIIIDKIIRIFFRLFFFGSSLVNKNFKYEYLEKDLNFVIIKHNLQKEEAKIELLKLQRLEKLRNII